MGTAEQSLKRCLIQNRPSSKDSEKCMDETFYVVFQNSHNLSGTRQQQSVAALVLASNSEISVQKPQQQNLFSKKKTTIITVKTPNIGRH